jgi:hypothetical protein
MLVLRVNKYETHVVGSLLPDKALAHETKNPLSFRQNLKTATEINRLSFYFWPQEIAKNTISTRNYYFSPIKEYDFVPRI